MLRIFPFLSLFVFLAGWAPLAPTPVDPPADEPALHQPAALPDTHDDSEAGGNIDPLG